MTKGIAEAVKSIAEATKVRKDEHSKLGPKHNQVAETTTRLELFKETIHVKVKVTSSPPSSPLTVQCQDQERGGHANRSAAPDVADKQLEDDRTVSGVQLPEGESLCRTCEMTRRWCQDADCQVSSWESAVKRQQ